MSQFPRHPFNHWLLQKYQLIPSLDAAALCLPLHCRLGKGYVPLNLESRGNRSCLKWLLRDHFIISEHQLWFQRAKKVSHLKKENYSLVIGKRPSQGFFTHTSSIILLHNFFFFSFLFGGFLLPSPFIVFYSFIYSF